MIILFIILRGMMTGRSYKTAGETGRAERKTGSMEKYNRSIENLNDLKTLNGALIYLNELRIELQWNSNNEAYKKLLELVHRKFEE